MLLIGVTVYGIVSTILNLNLAKSFSWTDQQDTKVTASMVDAITGNFFSRNKNARPESVFVFLRNRMKTKNNQLIAIEKRD